MNIESEKANGLEVLGELPLMVHLCQFYESTADFFEAALYLIREKKKRNLKCLWVYPDEIDLSQLLSELDSSHIYASAKELEENLHLVPSSSWYQLESHPSREDLRSQIEADLSLYLEKSYTGLCIISHIPSSYKNLHSYTSVWEEVFRVVVPHTPIILMCQYDLKKHTSYDIVDITSLHEHILTKRNQTWHLTTNSAHEEITSELERSRNFYLTLFEEFPALIWRAGLDGLCNYFNKNWLAFTGRDLTQELGNGWAEGIHPEDYEKCLETYMENFKERTPFYMEYRIKRFDGVYRWISDMGMPFYDMSHNFAGYIGSCYDITDHREMEDNLRIISKQAQEANLSKSIFLSNMSHEIRTPMNGVIGMLELLSMTDLGNVQRDYIDKAVTSAHLLLRIINDILDLSKIEAGKLEFENRTFNIHQVIDTVLETLRPNANKKNLVLLSHLDESLPPALVGDPIRISQILINLMNNAIKFTDIGRVTVCVDLVSETPSKATLLFAIKDTGIGIPGTQMNELFTSFSQLSNAGPRKFGGTGLGLVISKQLVNQMGGELQVESVEDKGSTFYFAVGFDKDSSVKAKKTMEQMRHAEKQNSREKTVSSENTNLPHNTTKPRLLVAEDDEINQQILSVFLSDYFTLDIVSNGMEALELFKVNPHDIILMDVLMPIMNGFEATEAIRSFELLHGRRTPIIGFTAYAMTSDGAKCINAGMDSYISKPIDKKTLIQKLLEYAQ